MRILFLTILFATLLYVHPCWAASAWANLSFVQNPPAIEQLVDSGNAFWNNAVQVFGMCEFNHGLAPARNAETRIFATREALYLQVCAEQAAGVVPLSQEMKRDGKVYFDDCIEVALALPDAPSGEYFQFSLNAANTVYDAYRTDPNWNGSWESRTFVEDGRWGAVFRIPFAVLGLTEAPEVLHCNVARTRLAPVAEQSVLVRSSPALFFGDLANALELRLGEGKPSGRFEMKETEEGTVVRATALVLPKEKFADFVVEVLNAEGVCLASAKSQSRFDSLQTDLLLPQIPDGDHTVRIAMRQPREFVMPAYYGGGIEPNPNLREGEEPESYLEWSWPIHVDNAPKLSGEVKLSDEGRKLLLTVVPQNVDFGDGAKYRIAILDEKGETAIKNLDEIVCEEEEQLVTVDISEFPERTRFVANVELSVDGEKIVSGQFPFATPPKPVWKGTSLNIPDVDHVPAPWTPVQLKDMTVSCWGRTFEFSAASPVPVQVISQNTPLLALPARLVTTPAVDWKLVKSGRMNPSCVRFDYEGTTEFGDSVSAFSEVYFDGVVRTDMTLPPQVRLSEMYLELPCRKEVATFVHDGPGQFGGMFNIRLCDKIEKHAYLSNYMLLNDNVGLGWFDAMPFDWPLEDSNSVIVMTPAEDRATVRVKYVDNGKTYARERRFSWGLQAFPARPMPEEEQGMRMNYAVRYGDEDRTAWYSSVDYSPIGNIQLDRGALEFVFQIPAIGEDEPLVRIAHGETETIELVVQKDGRLAANSFSYGAWRWKLASMDSITTGAWHKVGLNWGDGKISLWLDGDMVESCERPKLVSIFPSNISVGGIHCIIDDFRISSEPRMAFGMGPLTADEQTLLYDTFDKTCYVNGRRATIPEKISDEAEAGYLLPDTELVKVGCGQAVGSMTKARKSVIQGYAALGFQVMCYHASQYTDEAFAGLYIKDEAAFRKNLKAIHDAGMKAIVYTGNDLSNFDRSWNTYADEWLIEPRGVPFVQSWIPDEKGYQACPRSGYIDYFFHRIGRLMDDYGVDGIFLDGRMEAQCSNARHGCGVEDFEGRTVSKRDVWKGRMLSWQLYNIVQSRGGYCEQHKSGNWNIPDCFFWNGVWEGEQLMGVQLNGRKRLEVCPLEAMRGEINGIPFGMPSRNTAYSFSPLSPIENCALSFVHGTAWTMTYRIEEAFVVSPYWLAQRDFGATKQNFVPYWVARPPAKSVPNNLVKVSAHVKEGRALIMVANFNEESKHIAGTVCLDLEVLGIRKPVLKNAFSGDAVSISQDGEFIIDIKSFRQDWYIVEEAQ